MRAVSVSKNRNKRKQLEGFYTTQEWIDLKEQYDNRCLCCLKHQSALDRVLEQDHIIPVTKAGSTNWITNIQPLCHTCNNMGHKGTKTIDYRPTFSEHFHSLQPSKTPPDELHDQERMRFCTYTHRQLRSTLECIWFK